jgi:hypothetical protein
MLELSHVLAFLITELADLRGGLPVSLRMRPTA